MASSACPVDIARVSFPPTPPRSDQGDSGSVHSETAIANLEEEMELNYGTSSSFWFSRRVMKALSSIFWASLYYRSPPPSPPPSVCAAPTTPNPDEFYGSDSGGEEGDDEENDVEIPLPPSPPSGPARVLDIDAKTPDLHVPRDPRMVRLTGVHPFNAEAPLSTLFDQGFLTPPELFYVRNHGAVPQVLDDEISDWEVSIEGLVEEPVVFTFRQILEEFEQVTQPVTFVCAGNRRKEQNVVRKSQGFSWGPAGLSTSLFTGPRLADLVRRAKPTKRARFLWMEGADQLPNGNYGTSIKLNWVMAPERGIMLAHKMNGAPLTPDHGRPIRVVIPGQIGGRSVKWLKRIIISDRPSDNWYHKHDNRVLPTMVTPEMSKQDVSWWTDERYAIYDLSVNSVIAYPAHGETLSVGTQAEPSAAGEAEAEAEGKCYTFRGYAYTGGMRRVTRVELSLDKGATWELAAIRYPEDLYRLTERQLFGGRLDMASKEACYCWCFWELPIAVARLARADDVVLRAMDDSMTIQPRDMYWSVLGMMQNSWFRVAIRKEADGVLRFEHPTLPALQPGGWMERVKAEGGDFNNGNWGEKAGSSAVGGDDGATAPPPPPKDDVKMVNDTVSRIIELDELREHDNEEQPWFVVHGEVYDGTPFLAEHPGGAVSITSAAGQDATDEFVGIHSESAKAMMPKYHIGTLSEHARRALKEPAVTTADTAPGSGSVFLNPRAWRSSTLVAKRSISWDTRIFTFSMDHPEQPLGLPVGQHLMIKLAERATGEVVVRPYTPLSSDAAVGTIDVLVKVYFDCAKTGAKGGKMTQALDALPLGERVDFKGPIGKFTYRGRGRIAMAGEERGVTAITMICAGSGITPILAVLRAIAGDSEDGTRCVVLDGNRHEEDILCRDTLDTIAREHAGTGKVRIVHTLSKPGDGWAGRRGRVDEELIRAETAAAPAGGSGGGHLWLVCGPVPLETEVRRILTGPMGVAERDLVFF